MIIRSNQYLLTQHQDPFIRQVSKRKLLKRVSMDNLKYKDRKFYNFTPNQRNLNQLKKTKLSKKNYLEISKFLFKNVKKNNLIYLKNFYKKFKKKKSLQSNLSFNLRDKDGCYLSHYAVWHNNIKLVHFLLNQNLDFNKHNYDGITPLMIATLKGHIKLVSFLLRIQKNVNHQDNSGNSILHYAVVKERLDILELILQHKSINIFLKNNNNESCLDLSPTRILIQLKTMLNNYEKFQQISNDEEINQKQKKQTHVYSTKIASSLIYNMKEQIGIKNFIVHSQIGKGSFGEVYLVQKKDTQILYAMKILDKEKIVKDDLQKYAITERNVLSDIDHPFIAKLRYAFQTKQYLFMIMEYYPGGDLGEYLQMEGRFKEQRAKHYICEIITAIEELHRNHIIFRDLKPENIVLDNQGHALLIDFGLSKQNVRSVYRGAKSFCGSVAYLAPEMIKKKGHGKIMDWYLLGVLLYEMLVGIPPYYDDEKEILFKNIENAKLKIPSYCSKNARDLLQGLLERNPMKRFGSKKGALEIKSHPWFADINWNDVMSKKLIVPQPSAKKVKLFTHKNLRFMQDIGNDFSPIMGWTFIDNCLDKNSLKSNQFKFN